MPFSGYQDLDPRFAQALQAFVLASPGITPFSGYRSIERQRQLWEASDKTGRMVARPGHSQHNFGRATDLKYASDEARQWAHANAAKYGLVYPMSYEPWHVELIGARGGNIEQTAQRTAPMQAAASSPDGVAMLQPPEAPGVQPPMNAAQDLRTRYMDALFGPDLGANGSFVAQVLAGRNPIRSMVYSRLSQAFGLPGLAGV